MERLNLHWLKEARRSKHLKLENVGTMINKDRSTMWRYEAGKIAMTIDILFQLLDIYEISIVDVVMVTKRKD